MEAIEVFSAIIAGFTIFYALTTLHLWKTTKRNVKLQIFLAMAGFVTSGRSVPKQQKRFGKVLQQEFPDEFKRYDELMSNLEKGDQNV